MAFSYTKDQEGHAGNMKIVAGSFANTLTSTGGDIATGLQIVNTFIIQGSTGTFTVNETFPLQNADGTATIVTTTGVTGSWIATGI